MTDTLRTLPVHSTWQRLKSLKGEVGVDHDKQVVRGFVVAEEGPFQSDGRGEFDRAALRTIAKKINEAPKGLKSRFAHPSLSGDGIGTFLGRARDARRDRIMRSIGADDGKNTFQEIEIVRADLHLDPTSFTSPKGNLGQYVMDLADSDPDAFASSLLLQVEEEYRLDKQGRPLTDEAGNELPPLWRPQNLHAVDVVDTGDAVRSFLSAEFLAGLPDAMVRQGAQLLDQHFAEQPREVIRARCLAWLDRYLALRFDEQEEPGNDEVLHLDIESRLRDLTLVQSSF